MSAAPELRTLATHVSTLALTKDQIARERGEIHDLVLRSSRYIRTPNYEAIHPDDLRLLFDAYDQRFFGGLCRSALNGRRLGFRLSPRMTRSSGITRRLRSEALGESFDIAIGSSILFEGFRDADRNVTVSGLECGNRLEALQRVFEHELIHLIEFLCWDASNCSAQRFQEIAARVFLHQAHTHNLITRRERAAEIGIRVGSRVRFTLEGRTLTGFVNRITKRATVLVESAEGRRFSDGKTYATYYVPLRLLRIVTEEPGAGT